MTIMVNIHDAKTHLSRLLERVSNGERVIIARAGKPIAEILPIVQDSKQRVPGNDAGKVVIKPDFDAPLPEFEQI